MSSAASCSVSRRIASGTPHVSSASTSTWAARTGTSSARCPVRTLMTPPGTSDVASTSVRVTAGSGRVSDASRTTALPLTSGGASRDTSPRSDDVSGATTPTSPVGSGIVKLKYGAATGLDEPRTWAILSAQPAYQTQRSMARSTTGAGSDWRQALGGGDLGDELVAPALHELGDAIQDLAAVHRRLGGPAGLRLAGGPDGVAEVLAGGPAGVGHGCAVGGPDEVRAAALGPRERAADVQLVRLEDRDPAVTGPVRGRYEAPSRGHRQRSSSRT